MIKRIVKLTFHSENVAAFTAIFEESKDLIAAFPGCQSVELLNDISSPVIFFTFSVWDSEDALNNYRNSELFERTWARTKVLFSNKPEAWTVVRMAGAVDSKL